MGIREKSWRTFKPILGLRDGGCPWRVWSTGPCEKFREMLSPLIVWLIYLIRPRTTTPHSRGTPPASESIRLNAEVNEEEWNRNERQRAFPQSDMRWKSTA